MTESAGSKRRVILTVDVDSYLPSTLELAAALAQAQSRVLHGLFVEDVDLLNVAGLPFSQEVMRLCGRPRVLDDRGLERSFVRVGEEFRRILERHADRLSLSWSFSRVRGRKRTLELGEEEGSDILVIAQPPGRRRTAEEAVRRILLALDHNFTALPALEVILDRYRSNRVELILLQEEAGTPGATPSELLDIVQRYPRVTIAPRPWGDLYAVLARGASAPDCILASRTLEVGHMAEILARASCPVIVIS